MTIALIVEMIFCAETLSKDRLTRIRYCYRFYLFRLFETVQIKIQFYRLIFTMRSNSFFTSL